MSKGEGNSPQLERRLVTSATTYHSVRHAGNIRGAIGLRARARLPLSIVNTFLFKVSVQTKVSPN